MLGAPIHSERPWGETIETLAFPRHESVDGLGDPVLVADVARVDILAFVGGQRDPIWTARSVSVASVLSDTVTEWPIDDVGYTFRHTLPFGGTFQPRPGVTVKLEFYLWRTSARGPVIIEHFARLGDTRGLRLLTPI